MPTGIKFGILTVSDTCFRKEKPDVSGARLQETLQNSFLDCQILIREIVPDDVVAIKSQLNRFVQIVNCDVVLTTGGTGFSPRDVTPEATREVIEREAPGMASVIVSESLKVTPMAMLSRSVCGIKGKTLIVNLPGSAKGAVECLGFILPALRHAVDLLNGEEAAVAEDHRKIQRPVKNREGPSHREATASRPCSPSKVRIDNVAGRARSSLYPLVEVEQASDLIFKEVTPTLEFERIPIETALYRVLAEDIVASEPIPQFNASIKDGYAVLASDGAGPRMIKNFSAAGDDPKKGAIKSGEAIRICTGAPLPEGADAIVQVENTTLLETSNDGKEEVRVNIDMVPVQGQDIRLLGSDVAQGSVVLNRCHRLKPADIGILATVGKPEVKVFKQISVAVLSTGNELVDYQNQPKPGQIRDSNRLTLINLIKQHYHSANDCGIVTDNPDKLKEALTKALIQNDVVITTGGVSMGEFDLIKQILVEDFDAFIHFGRINMKPGKPTTFATLMFEGKKKMVFGLPGNPVSSGVTCLLFVIPTLKYLERSASYQFPKLRASLPEGLHVTNADSRPEYLRVHLHLLPNGDLVAHPNGAQVSSRLNSLVGANGLLKLSPNFDSLRKGRSSIVYVIDSL